MARQTCPLSSRHTLCLISVCFTAFLIQSNESLIPTWGTRCINSQAVSGSISHNEKNRGCLRTAFSRAHKLSVLLAAGSNSGDGDNETPVMFFADKDTDTSDDSNDDGAIEKESPEEVIANEKKIAEEKAEKERLAEEAENERMEKERVAERQKAEEALRLAAEEQREMQLQGLKDSVGNVKESVENIIVSTAETNEHVRRMISSLLDSASSYRIMRCTVR